jgi:hypothetical protein
VASAKTLSKSVKKRDPERGSDDQELGEAGRIGSELGGAAALPSTRERAPSGSSQKRWQAALQRELHLSRVLDKTSRLLYNGDITTTTRHPARPHVGDIRTLAEELIATRLPDEAEWIIAVGDIAQIEGHAAEALHLAVREARGLGATWQEIGDLLRVTRSAAQQRFRA